MTTRRFAVIAVCVSSLALSLAIAERCIRYLGLGPWPPSGITHRNEPVFHVPDPVLGWRNKAGDYSYPPYVPGGSKIHMTIARDGSRSTGGSAAARGREIWLVGCSYTFGQAVSDEETFAWQLQQLLPTAIVRNLGVGGYGTLQSLMLLEERLRETRSPPIVVYGFLDAHEIRNVAQPLWTRLLAIASRSGMVAVPFATLDGAGELVRHPPTPHPQWPLRRTLAVVSFLQDRATDLVAIERVRQAHAVTERLLVEMNTTAAKAGGKLVVALLYGWPSVMHSYQHFLEQAGIPVADCMPPQVPLPPELMVAGEHQHPIGLVNQGFAACIAKSLQRDFPGTSHQGNESGVRTGSR